MLVAATATSSSCNSGYPFRFYLISYSLPCLFLRRMGSSECDAHVIDKYWNVLRSKGSQPNIERALAKIKAHLKLPYVEKVVYKCVHNKMVGLRFFIWAAQQPTYKHSYYVYKTIGRYLGVIERPQMLSQVLADMRKEGCGVSIKTFRVLFNFCKEGSLVEEALELLELMKEFNCRPDLPVYKALIHLLCEARQMNMAKAMLKQMYELGLSPDVITYNTLIQGFTNVCQLEDAQRLVDEMREHGCVPNVVIYTNLLSGFCKSGNPDKGLELVDEMIKKQCTPNVVTYTALIQSFCEAGRIEEAMEIFDRMTSHHCAPNTVTYNGLIKAFCKEGKIDDAYKIMEKFIGGGYLPKDLSHNSLLIELVRANKILEAENLLKSMLESGMRPNLLAYNTFIKGFCLIGRSSDSLRWYYKMENMECLLEPETCSILLLRLCYDGYVEEAAKLLEGMAEEGILFDISTSDVIIDHLHKVGRHEEAFSLLRNLNDWRTSI